MIIDMKRFKCDCGTYFTVPQSINGIYDDFKVFDEYIVQIQRDLSDNDKKKMKDKMKQVMQERFEKLKKEKVRNKFMLSLAEGEDFVHSRIEIEHMDAIVKFQNATTLAESTEIVLVCPVCGKEAYRVKERFKKKV